MPAELWAVLVGGAIALVPLTIQLSYDRAQKKHERRLQLRRDIYLEAAEALAGSLDDFFQMTRADEPLATKPESPRRHGWLNKIILVGDLKTVVAFSEASASVAAAVLDVLVHRLAVAEVDDETQIAKDEVARIQQYQQELKNYAASFEREAPTQNLAERLEWIAGQLQTTWIRVEEQTKNLQTLSNERWLKQRVLMEMAMRLGLASQKLVRRAQLAARGELEMTPFGSDFDAVMERLDSQIVAKADEVFGTLQSRLTSST